MIESNDTNIKMYDIEQADTSFGAELDTNDELFDVELMETDELFDVELMESDELFDAAFDEDEQTMEVEFEEIPTQTPSGPVGTTDHSELINRDKPKQHPIKAIDGLEEALADKQPKGNYLTKVPEGYVKSEELEGYAKSEELEGYAKSEDIPIVPEWAMQPAKPNYTVDEVGADPSGSSAKALEESKTHTATVVNAALETSRAFTEQRTAEHNTDTDAHNDLRLIVKGLIDRVNALANSDDVTLDEMVEIVAYIKSNRSLIEAITVQKISYSDIVDNLSTNVSDKPLSAAQGVILKALFDAIPTWAKEATKPSYTVDEIGADPKGTAASKVSSHNDSESAHADIRRLIADIKVPTKVSELENDEQYLKEHQDLSGYALKSEVEPIQAKTAEVILFEGGINATTGKVVTQDAITLSDSAANYDLFDIYYASNDTHYSYIRVENPNGKNVMLLGALVGNTDVFLKLKCISINGKSITVAVGSDASKFFAGEGALIAGTLTRDKKFITITKVVGRPKQK